MKQRHVDSLRQRLVQRNGDTVEVDGSRLNANTVAELTGFLTDTTDLTGIAGEGARASGTRVIDRFDNPELVLPCLRALGRMGWMEVEGTLADPA
jgi:hypothetical protein